MTAKGREARLRKAAENVVERCMRVRKRESVLVITDTRLAAIGERIRAAAERAAEIFLKRRMYKSRKDGGIIEDDFVKLHYPCYRHYDILFGLKVMAEAGFIGDERCHDALALLEAKRLSDGGFPAEKKYYQATGKRKTGRSSVDWGGTSKRHMNEFVTADALYVLTESGWGTRGTA